MYLERRALPKANKITYARSIARDQGLHAARLARMKPSIGITAPAEHRHLRRNKKREQMMEGTTRAWGEGGLRLTGGGGCGNLTYLLLAALRAARRAVQPYRAR